MALIVLQRILVPLILRIMVLRLCHDDASAAHPRRATTLCNVLRRSYWPAVNQDVRMYTRSCAKCLLRKTPATCHVDQVVVAQPTEFGYTIQINLLDMHVVSTRGNRYIFAAVDTASDYWFLLAIPDKTAATAARAL